MIVLIFIYRALVVAHILVSIVQAHKFAWFFPKDRRKLDLQLSPSYHLDGLGGGDGTLVLGAARLVTSSSHNQPFDPAGELYLNWGHVV